MVSVSLMFLVRLWRRGELFGTQAVIFCVWFFAALVTQFLAQSPGAWIAGLAAQLVLAVVLVLKDRIDSIY